jgi:hypothetical protein
MAWFGGVVSKNIYRKERKMAIEDTFKGARNAFTINFKYLNEVAQEIGLERAVALHTKVCEAMGATQGKMIKKRSKMKEIDAKSAHPLARSVIEEGFGISSEVMDESPEEVVLKLGKCPVYEACVIVGLNAEAIETLCRSSSCGFMDTMIKQLNPKLNYQVRKFRSDADSFCEEAIVMD